MKKNLFILLLCLGFVAHAQTSFDSKIKEKTAKLDRASTVEEYDILFAEFSDLVRTDHPNRWQAYYYAGLTQYKKAETLMKANDKSGAIEANGLAYKYANGNAENLKPEVKKLLQQILDQKKRLQ